MYMPFKSNKQRRFCWYLYNQDKKKGLKPKWDCHKFAHHKIKGSSFQDEIKKKISKLQSKSLSGEELLDLVDNKAELMTYEDLTDYDDINECLGKYGALIILYMTRSNYGHWCCLIKHNDDHIEFFDSYGIFPDDEFDFIPKNFRMVSGQYYPHLTYLLLKSGYQIEYNDYKLQSKSDDMKTKISTCGRHVGCRILFRHVPLDDYAKMLLTKDGLTPDMKVTLMSFSV